MNRLRSPIAFRSLAVHRTPEVWRPEAQPSASAVPPPLAHRGFSALLARRNALPAIAQVSPCNHSEPPATEDALEPLLRDESGEQDERQDQDDGSRESADAVAGDGDADPWDDDLMPNTEHLDALLAQAAAAARARAAAVPPRVRALAATIGGFCNERAVSDSEGWNVHIPLRPDVLEDTTLDLAVSAHWLQLRFHAGAPESHRLLYEHEATLRELLAATLDRARDIALTID